MEQNYKNKLPKWYEEQDQELILTDDIDSLLACAVVMRHRHANISAFYDFDAMYYTDLYDWSLNNDMHNELIGVDCGLTNGKTYDNHVQQILYNNNINHDSINFNVVDNKYTMNYFSKYCGSTAIMLYSLFDEPLPITKEGKMILLAIDSSYKGYYSKYLESKLAHKKYFLDCMQFDELYRILNYCNEDDFKRIINKYNLSGKIWIENGKLNTDIKLKEISKQIGIELKLPTDEFVLHREYERKETGTLTAGLYNKAFSVAVTNKNRAQYSIERMN